MKRKISMVLALALLLVLAVPALAAEPGVPHVVDNAGVLSYGDWKTLNRKALQLSENQQFDFVILTVASTGAADPADYADDFFDYNGYGYGENRDGILLLISMSESVWQFSTRGFGITAYTDYGQDYMMESVSPLMAEGDFAGAFTEFLRQGDQLLRQAKNGKPLDVPEKKGGAPVVSFLICGALGFLLAFVPMSVLKKQVHNVAPRADAMSYVTGDGLELEHRTDRFLYSSVTRTARPKPSENSSGGGSATRTSSSGSTHGGHGGHF